MNYDFACYGTHKEKIECYVCPDKEACKNVTSINIIKKELDKLEARDDEVKKS